MCVHNTRACSQPYEHVCMQSLHVYTHTHTNTPPQQQTQERTCTSGAEVREAFGKGPRPSVSDGIAANVELLDVDTLNDPHAQLYRAFVSEEGCGELERPEVSPTPRVLTHYCGALRT